MEEIGLEKESLFHQDDGETSEIWSELFEFYTDESNVLVTIPSLLDHIDLQFVSMIIHMNDLISPENLLKQ